MFVSQGRHGEARAECQWCVRKHTVRASEEGSLELWLAKTTKTGRSEGLKMTEQEGWDFPSNRET